MIFINQENGRPINDMLLLMTAQEACEIRDDLERLIASDQLNDHSHINDADFKHQLTLAVYDENHLDGYQDHIKKFLKGIRDN